MTRGYATATRLRDLQTQLGPHDLAVLQSVSDLRFVSGAQLRRLHFADPIGTEVAQARAARRALLRLVQLDCLARLPRRVGGVRSGSSGFIYCLGLAGQKLAMNLGWQPKRRGRRSLSIGTLFLRHCLDIAELHVRLVEADRSRRLELIELAAEPRCWRSFVGLGSQRVLKPDSFVRIGAGDFELVYFIEVDRGTTGSRALEAKLREYLAFEASGIEQQSAGVFPLTLWLVPDAARARVIEGEIEQLASPARELFQVALFETAIEVICREESP